MGQVGEGQRGTREIRVDLCATHQRERQVGALQVARDLLAPQVGPRPGQDALAPHPPGRKRGPGRRGVAGADAHEVGAGQVRRGQVGAGEVDAVEVEPVQVGRFQVGARPDEVAVAQHTAATAGGRVPDVAARIQRDAGEAADVGAGQVASVEAAVERRVLEVGRRQVDVAEDRADVGPGQVGAAEVGTGEVDPRHRHAGEVGTGQVDVGTEQVARCGSPGVRKVHGRPDDAAGRALLSGRRM